MRTGVASKFVKMLSELECFRTMVLRPLHFIHSDDKPICACFPGTRASHCASADATAAVENGPDA